MAAPIEGSLNVEEPHNDLTLPSFELAPTDQERFYEKIEAKISILSDHMKDLEDTLKQFRERYPDDAKFSDVNKRFADMFLDNAEYSSSQEDHMDFGGDDGGAEGSAGDGKEGNDAEGSGALRDVEGCGQKTRFGRTVTKPNMYSPGPKRNPKKANGKKGKSQNTK
ncbi:hypothetical protein Tco_0803664 [Tanacetum coccineum]|uniref:Uncharacterized protein n=1 Tax=Tanacetum coccineum TaxID=301880 RepID=A0ABQ5A511_9ASTR